MEVAEPRLLDHWYVVAPEAVSVALLPEQMEAVPLTAPLIFTSGRSFTVT